ncbi:unnamed protein product [Meloidogyne enterolobii]|uniref:Uncharacterized protein n=1 Tax=Meloidogyne enterolobii TaxID=390850 RepID=A0ACB1AFN0_MELEN
MLTVFLWSCRQLYVNILRILFRLLMHRRIHVTQNLIYFDSFYSKNDAELQSLDCPTFALILSIR